MALAETAESVWEAWSLLDRLPRLDLPRGRLVVVSAHPDDEVLGAGGLLAELSGRPSPPLFVTVTDGEASHPEAPGGRSGKLRSRRAGELAQALKALGYPAPAITRLGLPDSGVADHVDRLAHHVTRAVQDADLVLCPSQHDGHIDHATVGRVVTEVCADQVEVWQFPIWVWHWTEPADPTVPWAAAGRVDISAGARRRKQRALRCFATQTAALPEDPSATVILPPAVLEHFDRRYEVFFR